MTLPLPPLRCDAFRQQLHFRHELAPREVALFDDHAAGCAACARLLAQCERLDDLLLRWQPEPAARRAQRPFEDEVLRGVRGEGPVAGCAETTASLHHLLSGDLEPWLAARVERHLEQCGDCADHREESRRARSIWQAWGAPDPSASFADALVRRLEPETRAARRRRVLLEWAFGPIRVPRAAAALVVASVTLLSLAVLRTPASPGVPPPTVLRSDVGAHAQRRPAVVPIAPAYFSPGGRSDPTGSLSRDLPVRRGGTLRSTMRGGGQRDETVREPGARDDGD